MSKLYLDDPVFRTSPLRGSLQSRPIDILSRPLAQPARGRLPGNPPRQSRRQAVASPSGTDAPGAPRVSSGSAARHQPSETPSRKPGARRQLAIAGIAAAMIFLGVGAVLFDSYRTTHKVAAQTPQIQQAAKEDRETAAGTPPGAPSAAAAPATSGGSAAAYQVPADQPKYIEIPKIRVKARVSPLGLDKTGAVAVPASTSRVGWYSNSARPSAPGGAALMVGHVSGYTRAGGVFINLKKLEAGDKITVTMGDDTTYTYTVATKKLQSKDTVDMTEALTPVRLDKKGLNLMTCAGKYDAKSETYDERLIVFAALE